MKHQAFVTPLVRSIFGVVAVFGGVASVGATAQADPLPSYAEPSQETRIVGRIASFDGRYDLVVRDERGYIDHVKLRQGTVITPTGLTLEAGMVVHVIGYNEGDFLLANEIDTPYRIVTGVPYFNNRVWSYYGASVPFGFYNSSASWTTIISPGYYGPGYGYRSNANYYYGTGSTNNYYYGPGARPGNPPPDAPPNYRYLQERDRERMQRRRAFDERRAQENRAHENREHERRREYRREGAATGQFGLPAGDGRFDRDRVGPPNGAAPAGPVDGPGMRRRGF